MTTWLYAVVHSWGRWLFALIGFVAAVLLETGLEYFGVTKRLWATLAPFFNVPVLTVRICVTIVVALIIALVITILVRRSYEEQRTKVCLGKAGLVWCAASRLKPQDFLGDRPFHPYYTRRVLLPNVTNVLADERWLADTLLDGQKRAVILLGPPGAGKTRLVFELLREHFKKWHIIRPIVAAPQLSAIDPSLLRGKKVVMILDDLQVYAGNLEPESLWAVVREARSKALIAICREGDEEALSRVDSRLALLFDTALLLRMRPLTQSEGKELARATGNQFTAYFDGTPASVLMGLDLMGNRFVRLDGRSKSLLQAIAILYRARVGPFTHRRVMAVLGAIPLLRGSVRDQASWWAGTITLEQAGFLKSRDDPLRLETVYLEYLIKTAKELHNLQRHFGDLSQVLENLKDAHGLVRLANTVLINEKRPAEALGIFEKGLNLRPDYAEAWLGKGSSLNNLTRPPQPALMAQALEAIERAISLKPNFSAAWNTKGYVLSSLGESKKSLEAVEKALELNPNYAEAWSNKGYLLAQLGDYEKGLQAADKALELNANYAEAWNNRGYALDRLGDVKTALAAFERALELDRNYAGAWNNKGWAFSRLGDDKKALEAFEKALELDPRNAEAWNNRGYSLDRLGDVKTALAAFEKALELDPNYASAWNNKGYTLSRLGGHKKALEAFEKALELDPHNAEAWNNKGHALSRLGDDAKAIDAFQKALDLDPRRAEAWNSMGYSLDRLGSLEKALEAFEKALILNPEYPQAMNNKGYALSRVGNHNEALQIFERVLELDPHNVQTWSNRGYVLGHLGRWEQAFQSVEKALSLNPSYAGAWNIKGYLLARTGRLSRALQAIDKALELRKDYVEAWANRGDVLTQSGRFIEAAASYDQALCLRPGHPMALCGKGITLYELGYHQEATAVLLEAWRQQARLSDKRDEVARLLRSLGQNV